MHSKFICYAGAPHSPPLEVSPPIGRKVPGETTFLHHLLDFVIGRPVQEASLAGLAPDPRPEGAEESAICPSPSHFGLVQPFAFPSFQRFRAYLFTPSKGVVLSRNSSAPSEGAQFPRVFCSPSEGAQSPGALCRACARVFVSSCLFPPSEGGPNPAVSESPLEGDHVYLYRNGRESRKMLPLWKGAGEAMLSRMSVERVQRKMMYRNGRESRKTLPLWKGPVRQCCLENL